MSSEKEDKRSLPELVLALDINKFESHFLKLGINTNNCKCPVCGSFKWVVAAAQEDKTKPMIVTLPIPSLQGKGIWHYSLICDNCAYTMLFNCGAVVRKMAENGDL
ncbi:MAG: hypothetical protein KIB03_14735 [Citrobacter freundii]|nr:hypothetical protein [Citrobacter freundii]